MRKAFHYLLVLFAVLTITSCGKESKHKKHSPAPSSVNAAVWVWASDMPGLVDNDAAGLKAIKAKGYSHIFLSEYVFDLYAPDMVRGYIGKCKENGLAVFVDMQALYGDDGWINPVKADGSLNNTAIDNFTYRAEHYVNGYGVSGIVMDNLRFPGTAYGTRGATSAITLFCQHVHIVSQDVLKVPLAVTLMPEKDDNARYYGQDTKELSKHAEILIPLLYRGNYNTGRGWYAPTLEWYLNELDPSSSCEIWPAICSFVSDADDTPLTEEEMRLDLAALAEADIDGFSIFRYGIGTLPSLKGIKLNDNWWWK